MKLIDVTVPLDANLSTYPGNTPFQLETLKTTRAGRQLQRFQRAHGAETIVIEGLNLRDVGPGTYEMFCLQLPIVGADGAPARVILRRS